MAKKCMDKCVHHMNAVLSMWLFLTTLMAWMAPMEYCRMSISKPSNVSGMKLCKTVALFMEELKRKPFWFCLRIMVGACETQAIRFGDYGTQIAPHSKSGLSCKANLR